MKAKFFGFLVFFMVFFGGTSWAGDYPYLLLDTAYATSSAQSQLPSLDYFQYFGTGVHSGASGDFDFSIASQSFTGTVKVAAYYNDSGNFRLLLGFKDRPSSTLFGFFLCDSSYNSSFGYNASNVVQYNSFYYFPNINFGLGADAQYSFAVYSTLDDVLSAFDDGNWTDRPGSGGGDTSSDGVYVYDTSVPVPSDVNFETGKLLYFFSSINSSTISWIPDKSLSGVKYRLSAIFTLESTIGGTSANLYEAILSDFGDSSSLSYTVNMTDCIIKLRETYPSLDIWNSIDPNEGWHLRGIKIQYGVEGESGIWRVGAISYTDVNYSSGVLGFTSFKGYTMYTYFPVDVNSIGSKGGFDSDFFSLWSPVGSRYTSYDTNGNQTASGTTTNGMAGSGYAGTPYYNNQVTDGGSGLNFSSPTAFIQSLGAILTRWNTAFGTLIAEFNAATDSIFSVFENVPEMVSASFGGLPFAFVSLLSLALIIAIIARILGR